jgi:hypothetical protein
MQSGKKKCIYVSATICLMGVLACQPVFVIGWREFFVVFILVALLIGLPLYRFIRRSKAKDK